MTKEEFVNRSIDIHGNKYDYSKVKYINMETKVCIICPDHGEFYQTPKSHIIRKYGCSKCGRNSCGNKLKLELTDFINKAKNVHGNKYDYSKVDYKNANTKICIVCPEHGEFYQTPHDHLKGSGCPKCGIETVRKILSYTNEEFIEKAKKKHGNRYDYSKTDVNKRDKDGKVCIICPDHGEFWQTPNNHINGQGCPLCANKRLSGTKTMTCEEFITKAHKIHGDKYDYSMVEYSGTDDKVCIICPKHGKFYQTPHTHICGHGCPKCGYQLSVSENEIYEYCCKVVGKENVIQRDREILNGKEIDILIPSIGIGIEYNGLKWHSEEYGKNYRYHINKLEEAEEKGIKLIQIFEDEYLNHKEVVLNKIAHLLKSQNNLPKIMGRKCIIKEIERENAQLFLDKFHIQGYGKCTVSLGAYYQGFLIGAMSFLNENNGNWNLVRFASDYNYVCQGVGSKLFKYFIKNYNPTKIKTFADRRWTLNREKNLYTELGFTEDALLKPDYRYVNPQSPFDRIHKFSFRKRCLHRKYSLPMKMTEGEMVKELGFFKIWDCGLIRYVWRK